MKHFLLAVLIVGCAGCSVKIYPNEIHDAEKACEPRGGLDYITVTPNGNVLNGDATCMDGSRIFGYRP